MPIAATHKSKAANTAKREIVSSSRATLGIEPFPVSGGSNCACGGGCPRCRSRTSPSDTRHAPSIVHDVLRTPGSPLPGSVRADMQEKFDHDLSDVRVHTDPQAARSAYAVNAHAYTVGSHIAFGAGRYAPHTVSGRRTLAHELTHVLQQRGATPSSALAIGSAGDVSEREADHVAARIDSAAAAPVQVRARHSAQMLRRQERGIEGAIHLGTLAPVSGVHGADFDAHGCFGRSDCDVHFHFDSAYAGSYIHPTSGRTLRAVRVIIRANHTPACGTCDSLQVIQVLRDTTHDVSGATVAAEPSDSLMTLPPGSTADVERLYHSRHLRSGWDDPSAPSRGWRVDAVTPRDAIAGYDPTDPFYTHTRSGTPGTGGADAVIQDAPSNYDTQTNVGRDFQTCLICMNGTTRSTLGCLTWGMYIDASGHVSIQPLPSAHCSDSTELRDAARRWDAIPGSQATDLHTHTASTRRRRRREE